MIHWCVGFGEKHFTSEMWCTSSHISNRFKIYIIENVEIKINKSLL